MGKGKTPVWKTVIGQIEYATSVVERIDRRLDDISARIPWRRSASEIVIRVGGRRKEQFLKALEMHSKCPRLGKFEIAHRVIEAMPAKEGDGYPGWRNLYNYMRSMDLRYGCFGS